MWAISLSSSIPGSSLDYWLKLPLFELLQWVSANEAVEEERKRIREKNKNKSPLRRKRGYQY